VTEALGDNLDRHAVREQGRGVGVSQTVQSDHRQLVLPQGLARTRQLSGEAAGEPFRMPMAAVELAQHERGVPDEVEGQEAASRPVGAERGYGAHVQVHDAGLSRLGGPSTSSWPAPLVFTTPTPTLRR
jgi:hypothetical protein